MLGLMLFFGVGQYVVAFQCPFYLFMIKNLNSFIKVLYTKMFVYLLLINLLINCCCSCCQRRIYYNLVFAFSLISIQTRQYESFTAMFKFMCSCRVFRRFHQLCQKLVFENRIIELSPQIEIFFSVLRYIFNFSITENIPVMQLIFIYF